jgi:hypothetical protein
MLTRTLMLAIALVSATTAFATTQDVYHKLWLKRAVDFNAPDAFLKPKAACVCQDAASPNKNKLGVFTKYGDNATCGIPLFDGSGGLTGVFACDIFEYIGK